MTIGSGITSVGLRVRNVAWQIKSWGFVSDLSAWLFRTRMKVEVMPIVACKPCFLSSPPPPLIFPGPNNFRKYRPTFKYYTLSRRLWSLQVWVSLHQLTGIRELRTAAKNPMRYMKSSTKVSWSRGALIDDQGGSLASWCRFGIARVRRGQLESFNWQRRLSGDQPKNVGDARETLLFEDDIPHFRDDRAKLQG